MIFEYYYTHLQVCFYNMGLQNILEKIIVYKHTLYCYSQLELIVICAILRSQSRYKLILFRIKCKLTIEPNNKVIMDCFQRQ